MSNYDPHAHLAEWLSSGWEANEADCERATIAWGHAVGHTLHLGTWQQGLPQLAGFDSMFDVWAFCVATTGIDPLAGLNDRGHHWTKRPQPEVEPDTTPVQAKMF
jgi:hypothetical protein